ncbi:Pyridoxal 5'-phosphate synthase subunit snz1 [Coemansia sp. S146]|nr:Pyridoxal 5'-phosphate synthase subunit snz1 [Coemansia sp. S146]
MSVFTTATNLTASDATSAVAESGSTFKPAKRARVIVQAVTHFRDAKLLAEVSENLGEARVGINCDLLAESEQLEKRGH